MAETSAHSCDWLESFLLTHNYMQKKISCVTTTNMQHIATWDFFPALWAAVKEKRIKLSLPASLLNLSIFILISLALSHTWALLRSSEEEEN